MIRWTLAAGAAALAITAPALAEKGGKGGGNDRGGAQSAKVEGGKGGGNHASRGSKHVEKAHFAHNADRSGKQDRGSAKNSGKGRDKDQVRVAHEGKGHDRVRIANDDGRIKVKGNGEFRGNKGLRIDRDGDGVRDVRAARWDRDDIDDRFFPGWNEQGLRRGFINGCPPGLAKKGNGCLPPGQARKLVGTPLPTLLSNNMLDGPYRDWYRDDDRYFYRGDDDYIYRVRRDGGLIDALFPSRDYDYNYYPVGMNYPMDYNYYNVPYQYQGFYPEAGPYSYRYGDGAIYQVNPATGMIQGIAALLAGDLAVGQQLPMSYGVYNVPFAYRDRYYDTPDAMYRYNDGYIYQVDPTTQLITAVINAIV